MSLNVSSADEDNDDDFGDAISILHGETGEIKKKRSKPGKLYHDRRERGELNRGLRWGIWRKR
jgi:hypothetical protein